MSKRAICGVCGQKMIDFGNCTAHTEIEYPDGEKLPAIPYEEHEILPCHDCGVAPGKYHHPGCDMARCPRCGGQLIFCECFDEDELDDE